MNIVIVIEQHDGNCMLYVILCGMSCEREVRLEAKKTKEKRAIFKEIDDKRYIKQVERQS